MTYIEAIAKVDHGYFLLKQISEKLSAEKSPINRMVDKACGYDETKELRELAITTINGIIEGKKALGFDYAKDVECLEKLKKIDEAMTESEILLRLKSGDKFTGHNGAFAGIVTPLSFNEEDYMTVECQKDGCTWKEEWDLLTTVWGFERGDYEFIEEE